jgi:transitional endoplasmic reticulum ATPase
MPGMVEDYLRVALRVALAGAIQELLATKDPDEENEENIQGGDEMVKVETQEPEKVHVAEVIRHGDKIVVPPPIPLKAAIEILQRQLKYESETVTITEDFRTFVWDGANALRLAMERRYGWVSAERSMGWFGSEPPQLIAVESGVGETVNIAWGEFSVPGITGRITTDARMNEGTLQFRLVAKVLRMHEHEIKALANDVREILRNESLYKGKAIKIRFTDQANKSIQMPQPKFLSLDGVREDELVFSSDVAEAIAVNLFTPIEHREECAAHGIPFKRGVLLGGKFGVGKTLVAYVLAKKCVDNGVTYIYCENINDFADVIQFAAQYQPAVVFCEDIDRVVSGERDIDVDRILNTIDGIESKRTQVMVVLTTNNVDAIHQAMIRPGRLDAVIHVTEPDAEAVIRLIQQYGRGLVSSDENLARVGTILRGQIPAVVREVVERAKLSAIRCAKGGPLQIRARDLETASVTMKMQLDLLNRKQKPEPSELAKLGNAIGLHIASGMHDAIDQLKDNEGAEALDTLAATGTD